MPAIRYTLAQGEQKTINNPFPVAAVGGTNNTPFYLKFRELPEDRQWVFPYTQAFTYPVDPPMAYVHVDASQTPPNQPVPPISTNIAQLTAYDQSQPYNPGHRVTATPPATPVGIGSIIMNLTPSPPYNLPPGTHAISLLLGQETGFGNIGTLSLVGQTSNVDYVAAAGYSAPFPGYVIVPVDSVSDSQVVLTAAKSSGTLNGVWSVVAFFDTQTLRLAFDASLAPSFPVKLPTTYSPQLWQAPNKIPVGINALAVPMATDTTIIAASGTLSIYPFDCWFQLSVTAVMLLYDGPSATGNLIWASPSGTGPFYPKFNGAKLTAGNALVARTSVAISLYGSVAYSQG